MARFFHRLVSFSLALSVAVLPRLWLSYIRYNDIGPLSPFFLFFPCKDKCGAWHGMEFAFPLHRKRAILHQISVLIGTLEDIWEGVNEASTEENSGRLFSLVHILFVYISRD